jgi:hypothetical protein
MMLCEKCQTVIKPVVACDIDGTLGDYHRHLNDFAAKWLGIQDFGLTPYRGGEPHREWFCRNFEVDETTFRQIKLSYRQGGLKRWMPMWSDAFDFCQSVRLAGAELWLTTTRPYEKFDRTDPDTREWLDRHDIHFDALIYEEDKYEALQARAGERVCFVLDDLTEQLERAENLWPGTTVKIARVSNELEFWPVVSFSLHTAGKMAKGHIEDWKAAHHFDDLEVT